MVQQFYSNGKLLLSAEYVVLDGARALAVPTQRGQRMSVETNSLHRLIWKSYDVQQNLWLTADFDLKQITEDQPFDKQGMEATLLFTLRNAHKKNPSIFASNQGYNVECFLEFDRSWGLGSSSTWINNIATWFAIDPFELLYQSFGGSGYDIACAQNDTAILYQKLSNTQRVTPIDFNPSFKQHLYFVHLNQKQCSKQGIANYRARDKQHLERVIEQINELTDDMCKAKDVETFAQAMIKHEQIISDVIQQPTVQQRLFFDFKGAIKSLGAWGGDFVLVAYQGQVVDYFVSKGYSTVIPYSEMIK